MSNFLHPTPYNDVNAVLQHILRRIRAILDRQFTGMYLYGSLALGDFDPQTSDIDFIAVTKSEIADELFAELLEMHEQFDGGGSPWARRIEAAYVPQEALYHSTPTPAKYPQAEKGTKLFMAPLETGWAFQLYSLRERGVIIAGPDPRTITGPVDRESMRQAVAAIAGRWQEQASNDPEWLEWVRHREWQSFVVLTLCRMLYSLDTGDVTSKPEAGRWAKKALGSPWAALIDRALARQHSGHAAGHTAEEEAPDQDVEETLALIRYTVEQSLNK